MADRAPMNPVADRATQDRKWRLTLLIVGSVITLLMVYGSGMRAQVKRIRDIDERRKMSEQDLRQAQRTLRLRLAFVAQLEARRQVAQALGELDKRNFGIAQSHVTEAARLLDQAQQAGTIAPDLTVPEKALNETRLTAATDVSAPRDALLTIAAQMDAALDSTTKTFLETSAAEDAAHPIKPPTMNDVPNATGHSIMPDR